MDQKPVFKYSRKVLTIMVVVTALLLELHAESAPSSLLLPNLSGIVVKAMPIQSDERKMLMREYSRIHYGIDEWRLIDPRLIVIHYTGTDSDFDSLYAFKPIALGSSRDDIKAGGDVNVGVHYVITRDGVLWTLLSEMEMGRHAIGFNYVALGIEMTGSSEEKITSAQLESCAALVADIARRTPSVQYLCGHHEYVQEWRAHYFLYKEIAPGYKPTVKIDPGEKFMTLLRARLKSVYNIQLGD